MGERGDQMDGMGGVKILLLVGETGLMATLSKGIHGQWSEYEESCEAKILGTMTLQASSAN